MLNAAFSTRTWTVRSEPARLDALRALEILDTEAEPAFDDLVALGVAFCRAPMGALSLVDADRQWFKARQGLAVCETERSAAFCAHVVSSEAHLVIDDALEDDRFQDNPLVTGPPYIRAYLGAPVLFGGYVLGSLCVLDSQPRVWTAAERQAVDRLARLTSQLLEARARAVGLAEPAPREEGPAIFRQIVMAMREGVVLRDAAGVVIDANPRAAEILGVDIPSLLGAHPRRRDWLARSPDGVLLAASAWPDCVALREGRVVERFAFTVETPNGGSRAIETTCIPLRESGDLGPATHVVSIFADVTEERRARRETLRSAKRHRELLEALPVPIYTTDADGFLTYFNRAAAEFWGRRPVLGLDRWCGAHRLFTSDGEPLAHEDCPMAEALRTGRPVRGRQAMTERPDGVRIDFQPYPTPLLDAEGALVGGVNMLIDIADHKAADRRQAALIAQLEDAHRETQAGLEAARSGSLAKSAFLATMSHEIRTPLNGVLGMAQAMSTEDLAPAQAERLAVIRQSAEVLLVILNNVLDLSKIEAGRMELESVEFDLEALVGSTLSSFGHEAARSGVTLGGRVPPRAAGLFVGDPARIRQILYNLLSNAVKFAAGGCVRVAADVVDGRLRLEVEDDGVGMSADQQARLFQRFMQGDASITRRFGGTGLGLSICGELARLMGGAMSVRSAPGAGSTFAFTAPLARSAPSQTQGAPPSSPAFQGKGLRVLVVDDHPTNRLVMQTVLAIAGIEPTLVEDGEQAVAAWRGAPWDLVFMDIQMPRMDGVTATKQIRRDEMEHGRLRTPIIALTANAMPEQVKTYEVAGMDDCIPKPIDVPRLLDLIRRRTLPLAAA